MMILAVASFCSDDALHGGSPASLLNPDSRSLKLGWLIKDDDKHDCWYPSTSPWACCGFYIGLRHSEVQMNYLNGAI